MMPQLTVVFDLDGTRRADRARYEEQLALAWRFLNGETERKQQMRES